MVESLRLKVAHVESEVEQASRTWNVLRGTLNEEISGELQNKIIAMSTQIEECKNSLSVFKPGEEEISSESPAEVLVKETV